MSRDYICLWRLIGCIMVIVAFFARYSKTRARASTTAIKTQDVRIRIASCLVVATDRVHGGHCCVFTIATYTPIFALLHISALSVTVSLFTRTIYTLCFTYCIIIHMLLFTRTIYTLQHHYLFLKETPGACLAQDVGFGNVLRSKIKSSNRQRLSLLISLNLDFHLHSLYQHHHSKSWTTSTSRTKMRCLLTK
jgi:hypothetical protein